jgi:hypothetical protein
MPPDYISPMGMSLLATVGSIAKGRQWRNKDTGKIDWGIMSAGAGTSVMLAMIVRALGVHYNIEITAQFALAGIFGYIGPEPIMAVISKMLLKKFGGSDDK